MASKNIVEQIEGSPFTFETWIVDGERLVVDAEDVARMFDRLHDMGTTVDPQRAAAMFRRFIRENGCEKPYPSAEQGGGAQK